jgi:nucleotide-binding universal stress UspA family protein
VPDRARQSYQEWKQADARAREVEARLSRTWDDYFASRGSAPAQELIQEVSRLRAVANDRLTAAMIALGGTRRSEDDSDPGSARP